MNESKPKFKRQESWRYKRVAENWRRPRGVTSKMRKEESGFPSKVKVGYGSAASSRGLHPRGLVERIVWRESELERLDPKVHIVRIAGRVGEKKRLGIVTKAKENNLHIANPGKEESRPVTEAPSEKETTASAEAGAMSEQAETMTEQDADSMAVEEEDSE